MNYIEFKLKSAKDGAIDTTTTVSFQDARYIFQQAGHKGTFLICWLDNRGIHDKQVKF